MNVGVSSHSIVADRELSTSRSAWAPEIDFEFESPKQPRNRVWIYFCLALLAAIGSLGLAPELLHLWGIWTQDPLRSIGLLIVPASTILVLRVWRRAGWELRGTWWGLGTVALAFCLSVLRQCVAWYWINGRVTVNFLPSAPALYIYASGVILLFAGARVWRRAWFPLALLLLAQPLPYVGSRLVDLPLQVLSAHIARSFASSIGFPPTNPELLRLMFTPDFGMFIAPGCDGLRGAVTLGYVALITGYLKRASISRWLSYVGAAVLLGYLFNLIRLCALVLYYRIAVGHPALENVAKQVDYAIGGCMFLIATLLFLWMVARKEGNPMREGEISTSRVTARHEEQRVSYWKIAAFALIALLFAIPGGHAIQDHRESMVASGRIGELTPEQLDDRMPAQLAGYKLNRTWQQQLGGTNALESAAYDAPGSNEITLNVWLLPIQHNVHDSLMIRGGDPQMRASTSFVTAQGKPVPFDTAYYSDGTTDSLVGNTTCTPSSCLPAYTHNEDGMHLSLIHPLGFHLQAKRSVPISFRIEMLHEDTPRAAAYNTLLAEAQRFFKGVDLAELSRKFQ